SLPPPPEPTLFPYTTLFRSLTLGVMLQALQDKFSRPTDNPPFYLHFDLDADTKVLNAKGVNVPLEDLGLGIEMRKLPAERNITLDRKSTRLNSSHVKISYAV